MYNKEREKIIELIQEIKLTAWQGGYASGRFVFEKDETLKKIRERARKNLAVLIDKVRAAI